VRTGSWKSLPNVPLLLRSKLYNVLVNDMQLSAVKRINVIVVGFLRDNCKCCCSCHGKDGEVPTNSCATEVAKSDVDVQADCLCTTAAVGEKLDTVDDFDEHDDDNDDGRNSGEGTSERHWNGRGA
jgi:hypothetical protein